MDGRAAAPAAGTVLNALATGTGAAFAIDRDVHATVSLDPRTEGVRGTVAGAPDADTLLVERCVSLVTERFGDGEGGTVRTESDVPMAGGLKSSSAAANATVLATLDALGVDPTAADSPGADAPIDRADAARLGVTAAREVGVTVTGAFDDASASMLGGLTVTDNTADELLHRDEPVWDVVVWTPPERAYSADADVDACRQIAPLAETAADLALGGRYGEAMNVNGLAYCAALEFPTDPLVAAFPHAAGATLSGTGPSYVAVAERGDPAEAGDGGRVDDHLAAVVDAWAERPGDTWRTTTQQTGARIT